MILQTTSIFTVRHHHHQNILAGHSLAFLLWAPGDIVKSHSVALGWYVLARYKWELASLSLTVNKKMEVVIAHQWKVYFINLNALHLQIYTDWDFSCSQVVIHRDCIVVGTDCLMLHALSPNFLELCCAGKYRKLLWSQIWVPAVTVFNKMF